MPNLITLERSSLLLPVGIHSQVGLRSHVPDAKTMAWMRQNGIRSHFMAEVHARGWDTVSGRLP